MMELTGEQLRAIDAKVAECMGLELLSVGYFGTDSESKRQTELSQWLDIVDIRNVGKYWIDVADNWWVEAYNWEPTDSYQVWAVVEEWMIDNFDYAKKRDYAAVIQGQCASGQDRLQGVYKMLTAPLPIRCIAFLRAMGVEVEEVTGVNE